MAIYHKIKILKLLKFTSVIAAIALLSGCASVSGGSGNTPNILQMLQSIQSAYKPYSLMIVSVCYAAGITFLLKAFYDLHIVAKMSGSMGGQADYRPPLFLFVIAAMFLAFPGVIDILTRSVFGQSNGPLSYISGGNTMSQSALNDCIGLVQMVGITAFVRGWMLLARHGNRNGGTQPGNFGKSMTHIVGGTLAANISWTWAVLMSTVGFTTH